MAGVGKEKYQTWFWCAFKKLKFMQTMVQLHYVNNSFYVVKLCNCLHNLMVAHCIEIEEDPETEDMYNVTSHNENVFKLDEEEVKDNAHIDIQVEDIKIMMQLIFNHWKNTSGNNFWGRC